LCLVPEIVLAQRKSGLNTADLLGRDSVANRPLLLMAAMGALALVPFVGMMVTSFVKIAVVLSITRQALGTQQAPPTTVITGLAIILTVYVMQPVGLQISSRIDTRLQTNNGSFLDKENVDFFLEAVLLFKESVKDFLYKYSDEKNC
jgi:type III secretion protein R